MYNLKNYKSNIKLLNEKKLLGTAGTLRKNFNKLKNSDLMFIHCDNYSEFTEKEYYWT